MGSRPLKLRSSSRCPRCIKALLEICPSEEVRSGIVDYGKKVDGHDAEDQVSGEVVAGVGVSSGAMEIVRGGLNFLRTGARAMGIVKKEGLTKKYGLGLDGRAGDEEVVGAQGQSTPKPNGRGPHNFVLVRSGRVLPAGGLEDREEDWVDDDNKDEAEAEEITRYEDAPDADDEEEDADWIMIRDYRPKAFERERRRQAARNRNNWKEPIRQIWCTR